MYIHGLILQMTLLSVKSSKSQDRANILEIKEASELRKCLSVDHT